MNTDHTKQSAAVASVFLWSGSLVRATVPQNLQQGCDTGEPMSHLCTHCQVIMSLVEIET